MNWGYTVYIRLDLQGYFHTYPDLGGPYRSLHEIDEAIDRHLFKLRDPKMFTLQDVETSLDLLVRRCLYWPDGTIMCSKSGVEQRMNDEMRRLAQALVDKYNEDHYLFGDLAYELIDALGCNSVSEHGSLYYHLNFSATSKATNESGCSTSNLFFAEVKDLNQGNDTEVFVCCLCTVNPIDEAQCCTGCSIIGGDIKHPASSVELAAGHSDPRSLFGGVWEFREWHDSVEDLRAAEAKLRRKFEGLDDPNVIASLFTLPPGVTIVRD